MGKILFKEIKAHTKLDMQEIHHEIIKLGAKVSLNALTSQEDYDRIAMRYDTLLALQRLTEAKGVPLEDFWEWIRKDVESRK